MPKVTKTTKITSLVFGITLINISILLSNLSNIIFRNSETRAGAEVNIAWNNKDLKRI